MKDFLGNDINVSDIVATTVTGYHSLLRAKVLKITDKMVRVGLVGEGDMGFRGIGLGKEAKRFSDQVIVIKEVI